MIKIPFVEIYNFTNHWNYGPPPSTSLQSTYHYQIPHYFKKSVVLSYFDHITVIYTPVTYVWFHSFFRGTFCCVSNDNCIRYINRIQNYIWQHHRNKNVASDSAIFGFNFFKVGIDSTTFGCTNVLETITIWIRNIIVCLVHNIPLLRTHAPGRHSVWIRDLPEEDYVAFEN